MSQLTQSLNIVIALQECGDQGECVKLRLDGETELFLSPEQARKLASELIQTVYRAEVKNSLKKAPSNVAPLSLVTPHAA